jgi:hypothetical protein
MNTTSTTPALARAERSTRYTLARQLAGPYGDPYTILDYLHDHIQGFTRPVKLTNSIG